jgi:O-antigen/teichoic acid export membrane protein
MAASLVKVAVLFIRSILLARLLPVEAFGVYSLANSIVGLSIILTNFGMGGAFLHRAPESEDEEQAAAVHFTLKSTFTLAWAVLVAAGAFLFTQGDTRLALLMVTLTTTGIHLAQTPSLILTRRVEHRRLALIDLVNALLTTAVALGLAWQGAELWALLATDVVTLALTIFALYLWRPVWRPRFTWAPQVVRYFLSFGSRTLLADVLLRALDRVDDLWTGVFLGETPLGYYSRAYTFATYPRFVLALPINQVAGGTYAELKGDRRRVSKAFFRTNALMVRTGFLLAGLLALLAPEFIRIALGEKWMPMLSAFRLMLIYTLLDPIKITVADVITTQGAPEKVVRVRMIQLGVMVVGLVTLGPTLGISGVALAVDAMLVVGMALLFRQARAYVDFSLKQLFGAPALGLLLGIAAALVAMAIPGVPGSDWRTAAVKAAAFSLYYAAILLLLERNEIGRYLGLLTNLLRPRPRGGESP